MGFQTCKYRKKENGEIEHQMFDSDEIPDGWEDSPAVFKNGSEPVMENPPEEIPAGGFFSPKKTRKKRKKRGD